MRGGVIQIKYDDDVNYEYFQFIPKKPLFGSIEKAKDKELDILVDYTNNTDKYESFRILEKKENGDILENSSKPALKYEIACGSKNNQYYKINSKKNEHPVISKSSFSSYMNDKYVWRFKRIITAEMIEKEDLILSERTVPGPPEDDALAQKEDEPNTMIETYYRRP